MHTGADISRSCVIGEEKINFIRGDLLMGAVQEGDTVLVHYTGKLQNGDVFDSSKDEEPLSVKVGGGDVIPGFEHALVGMETGEEKVFELAPDQAYGSRREELVHVIDRKQIPQEMKLEVGMQLALKGNDSDPIPAHVVAMTDASVTLDTNHPLAGKSLTFEVSIVDIKR